MRTFVCTTLIPTLTPLAALAAQEESVNVVPDEIGLWVWTLGTFLVMFFILSKLAFKPMAQALDRRAKTIQKAVGDAEKDREEAKRMMSEYEKQMAESRAEAGRLIEEARIMGEDIRKEVVEKAKTEAAAVIKRAREEIELQKEKGIQDLKDTVARLSVQIASKVIEKEVDESDHRKLVEALIRDLGTIRRAS